MTYALSLLWWLRWRLLPFDRGREPSRLLMRLLRWSCPTALPCPACGLLTADQTAGDPYWRCHACGLALPWEG